jgi:hypothetical protein
MGLLELFGKKKNISPQLMEGSEAEFQQDFEYLKISFKDWVQMVSEAFSGDTQVLGEHSLGDLAELKKNNFCRQLAKIKERHPDKEEAIRSAILELSQDRKFTHISNPDQLANFGGEVRELFPPQSDEYSKI